MIRRPPRSTPLYSSAASDVYKRQLYNFVVAIDDALMGITDVIRGDDHLSNTPKQIVIYKALCFDVPTFYHVPMILNPQGKKLSKRDGAMDVMEYKKMGYLPEAILNFLIRLGWSHGAVSYTHLTLPTNREV